MVDVVAAFDQKADDRNGIRNVKKDDAGGDHAIESCITAKIQQS